jgi:hypothetical protein
VHLDRVFGLAYQVDVTEPCSRRPHFGSLGTPSFAHLMS